MVPLPAYEFTWFMYRITVVGVPRSIVENYTKSFPAIIPLTREAEEEWLGRVRDWLRRVAAEAHDSCVQRCEDTYCGEYGCPDLSSCIEECSDKPVYAIVERYNAEGEIVYGPLLVTP